MSICKAEKMNIPIDGLLSGSTKIILGWEGCSGDSDDLSIALAPNNVTT